MQFSTQYLQNNRLSKLPYSVLWELASPGKSWIRHCSRLDVIGGLGSSRDTPLSGQFFFSFMHFKKKIGQVIRWRPLWAWSPSPVKKSWIRYWMLERNSTWNSEIHSIVNKNSVRTKKQRTTRLQTICASVTTLRCRSVGGGGLPKWWS